MVEATDSITINRPPEVVFNLVSDPARDPEWNRHAVSVRKLSEGPARSTRYQGTYRGFGACALEVGPTIRPAWPPLPARTSRAASSTAS